MTERFLLDSNIFMTPYKIYYPFDLAPGFWEKLKAIICGESARILDVVKAEVLEGGDALSEWLNSINDLDILDRREPTILNNYASILNYIQGSHYYDDRALRAWSDAKVADPWIIATAAAKGFTIVSNEQSAGKITNPSHNPKLPDIARKFNVKCVDIFYFMRSMNIRWSI